MQHAEAHFGKAAGMEPLKRSLWNDGASSKIKQHGRTEASDGGNGRIEGQSDPLDTFTLEKGSDQSCQPRIGSD